MSTRTWILMILILAVNWGGFALALWYGFTRDRRKTMNSKLEAHGS